VFALSGTVIAAAGLFMLSRLGVTPPIWLAVLEMMVLGVGLGFTMQTYVVASQNSIPKRTMGSATSTLTLIRSLGATIGVTLLGVVFNNRFKSGVQANLSSTEVHGILGNPYFAPFLGGRIERMPSLLLNDFFLKAYAAQPHIIGGIKTAFADSISLLFIIGAAGAVAAFIITLFLRDIPLKSAAEYHGEADAGAAPVGKKDAVGKGKKTRK
jgi:hypothetical protein